jgi:hypothetical protein
MSGFCRAALAALLLAATVGTASAHGYSGGAAAANAIAIPSLSHGEMAVIADHRAAILALAGRQMQTDETFRRLLNYANIERMVCAWGLMPGSLGDETSPFNECAHAYLAATKALLLHMETMPGESDAATALATKVDADALARGAALDLCRYSDEPFNTSALVYPQLGAIFRHLPSLAVVLLLALAAAAASWLLLRATRTPGAAGVRY